MRILIAKLRRKCNTSELCVVTIILILPTEECKCLPLASEIENGKRKNFGDALFVWSFKKHDFFSFSSSQLPLCSLAGWKLEAINSHQLSAQVFIQVKFKCKFMCASCLSRIPCILHVSCIPVSYMLMAIQHVCDREWQLYILLRIISNHLPVEAESYQTRLILSMKIPFLLFYWQGLPGISPLHLQIVSL